MRPSSTLDACGLALGVALLSLHVGEAFLCPTAVLGSSRESMTGKVDRQQQQRRLAVKRWVRVVSLAARIRVCKAFPCVVVHTAACTPLLFESLVLFCMFITFWISHLTHSHISYVAYCSRRCYEYSPGSSIIRATSWSDREGI